jgi:hypothetical protein
LLAVLREVLMNRRELRLYASGGALLVGGWWGTQLVPEQPISAALLVGYIMWALFWGVPPVWRWWRKRSAHLWTGCSVMGCLFTLSVSLALFLSSAWFYSLFGGGIYEFVKCLRSARRPASGP